MGEQIIAGLVVAGVVGLFGLVWQAAPPALRKVRARLSRGRVLLTGAVQTQLMDGIGESNLVHLLWEAPGAPQQKKKMLVEIETPDEQRVWSIDVPLGYKMSDLALAARSHFKLRPTFFRLINKARQQQPLPDDQIESAVKLGDRLKMVEYQGSVWGWGRGSKRGWLRALADKALGVKVIKRLGPYRED